MATLFLFLNYILEVSDMNDEMAKQIIKAYEMGEASLSEYVNAIEHMAIIHPDMTMSEVNAWANDDIYMCDPEKNTECTKTGCYINDGPCHFTCNKEFEKEGVIL